MPLTLGPSDYTLFDGQSTITYTRASDSKTQSVANAVNLGPIRHEVQTDGGFLFHVEAEWWLPLANMGGIVPAEGDYITDGDGVKWYLQSDIEPTANGIAGTGVVYRVVTRQGK